MTDVIWPGTLGEHMLDLAPYLDEDARHHVPELVKNDTVQGRLVGLPFYLNVGMLYYREDLLKKYGYDDPPENWDDLEDMATRIQKGERAAGNADFWGFVWQGAAYEGLTCNALEWQVSFGGGRIIEPDGTVTVNNAHAVRAFRNAARWVGSISPVSVLSYTESDSLNAFRSGNAAFMRHWSAGFPLNPVSDPELRGRFKPALLPAGPKGRAQTMGGFHLAVSRYSAHLREAAQLVRYLTGREVQLRRALRRGYLPTIPDLYQDPGLVKALPQAEALRNAGLDTWVARPSTVTGAKYGEVSKAYYRTVHDILSRKVRAEEALAVLEKQLVSLTGFKAGAPGK